MGLNHLDIIAPMMPQRTYRRALAWVPKPIRRFGWNALQRLKRETPALLMSHPGGPLPATVATDDYAFRQWQPGDDPGWLSLLNKSRAFGDWDEARLALEMAGLLRECQHFALSGTKLVAAAGVLERLLHKRPALEIAWVVRDPVEKGHQLGRGVTLAALQSAQNVARGRPIFLYTDDHRLTAIEMYFDLGFVPDLHSHRTYPERWERILRDIALRRQTFELPRHAPGGGDD